MPNKASKTHAMIPLLKQATIDDVAEVLTMMRDFFAIDGYPFNAQTTQKNLLEFIDNPALGRLWLIQSKHETVGYLVLAFGFSFEYGGKDAFIDEFYFKAPFRGQGMGNHVLNLVQEKSKELNINTLHLEVEQHNKRASHLYRKHGFTNNGRHLLSKKLSS